MKQKLTIALLSGGISSERKVSLYGGDQVYEALDKKKYIVTRYDPKTDLDRLLADASKIDLALIILHGPFGEDGTIQGFLDLLDIPYQGSGVLGSAIAMNKLVSKKLYEQSNIPVPPYIAIRQGDKINPEEYVDRLGIPLVIKPVTGGSSIGMSIVKSIDSLKEAIDTAFSFDDTILIETYIKGIELTGAVIGNDKPEVFPVVEIIPDKDHDFFDFHAKYTTGITQEICPANIDDNLTEKAGTYAKMAHQALSCKGYSRTDMILDNKDIYILETNTIPGMTKTSLFPLAAKTAGISFDRLLDRLIELGLKRHKSSRHSQV
ncbi:MAG: D-alanine--D-alanine ligase [Thermodesulfobacteriota bacterium]|nr:D-alanine--D-alanine ligase [Thermodesulfobacteriota bacterium]